jgi:hypothetical protein
MTSRIPTTRTLLATIALLHGALLARDGAAQESGATREAARHFQRGVALYGEADYRAALVEFKRAFALAPNPTVLYNVGETEYQLQDYAGALTTFERYLAEAGAGDGHRSEVEANVEVLRARVGHLAVLIAPALPGVDLSVDDQAVGKTPLDRPLLVSIGRRKVVASMPGRPSVTRYVDVAADDTVSVTLQLAALSDPSAAPAQRSAVLHADAEPLPGPGAGPTLRTAGWIATGAFASGAVVFGVLADRASNELGRARATYPTTSATLSHDASLTTTYAIVADSLAAAAVFVGGLTLYSTFASSSSSSRPSRGNAGEVRVGVGPGSARLEVKF